MEDTKPIVELVLKEYGNGRPVIVPTETLYGLSAPLSSPDAIDLIFSLKKRPKDMTLPVAVGDLYQVDSLASIFKWQRSDLRNNLPGPVTFLLEAGDGLPSQVIKDGKVAIRVPRHPIFRSLVKHSGPLALTSANVHGGDDFRSAASIDELFKGELLTIEDDRSLNGEASAIVDITGKVPVIIREGKVNISERMEEEHGG